MSIVDNLRAAKSLLGQAQPETMSEEIALKLKRLKSALEASSDTHQKMDGHILASLLKDPLDPVVLEATQLVGVLLSQSGPQTESMITAVWELLVSNMIGRGDEIGMASRQVLQDILLRDPATVSFDINDLYLRVRKAFEVKGQQTKRRHRVLQSLGIFVGGDAPSSASRIMKNRRNSPKQESGVTPKSTKSMTMTGLRQDRRSSRSQLSMRSMKKMQAAAATPARGVPLPKKWV